MKTEKKEEILNEKKGFKRVVMCINGSCYGSRMWIIQRRNSGECHRGENRSKDRGKA